MKLTSHTENTTTIILKLEGELDASSSVLLDEQLSNPEIMKFQNILIDCTGLTYISSAGLGVFMAHLHRLEEARIKLVFFNMAERVRNVFQILGLDVLTTIAATKTEALILSNG